MFDKVSLSLTEVFMAVVFIWRCAAMVVQTLMASSLVALSDIDECANDTICGNHGFCENTDGSFRCHCDQGYTNPPGDTSRCVGL